MNWRKFNGEPIHLPIKDQVRTTIESEIANNNKLSVYIGTDSQVKQNFTEFATVIVFLRRNNGGFMFIHNEKSTQQLHIKERLLLKKVLKLHMNFVTYLLNMTLKWKCMLT